MLEATGLAKSYGSVAAVRRVSLSVGPGEVVGLVGPNGAGKTTTLSMLATVLRPDEGEVRIGGALVRGEADPVKRRLGLVPQDLALYEPLTARANLELFGALQGLRGRRLDDACRAALAVAGLEDRARDRVETFSGGMKRRLNLAAGILHDPDVLLLDEPTVGVDPQSRAFLLDAVLALRARGKAVLYTSHYLEEVERLCDRLVVLDHGRILAEGTASDIARGVEQATRVVVELEHDADPGWERELTALPGIVDVATAGPSLRATVDDVHVAAPALLAFVTARGGRLRSISTARPTLEEAFLTLTGKRLRDA